MHQVLQFGHRERLGIVLTLVGVHQRGDEVVARFGPAAFELCCEVMLGLEFDLDGLEHFGLGQRAHGEGEHRSRPPVEAVDLGAVQAELLGDDDPGQRHREVEVELALPSFDQPVDQAARDVVDVVGHVSDTTRQEGLGDETTVRGVDRRVGALQRLDVAPPAFTQDLLIPARDCRPGVPASCLLHDRCSRTARGW